MIWLSLVLLATIQVVLAQHACVDRSSSCVSWSRIGYCKLPHYVAYMKQNCPKSCGFCTGGSCADQNSNCRSWSSQGYCSASWAKKLCPKSCGTCGGPQTPRPPTPNPGTNPPGSCGVSSVQGSRVIAGETAKKGAWPWQILMLYNGRAGCGGSLVAPNWVVTAAHCVSGKEHYPRAFRIRFGEHDRNQREGTEEEIEVSRVITHPMYSRYSKLDYDIALFKLSRPPRMNKYVSPVCLPQHGKHVPVGTECYITGWGKIRHPGRMHYILQQGKFPVVENRVCDQLNRRTTGIPVTKQMVCAGHGGRTRLSGCHGDSGGPFVCRTGPGGTWELHGAVSWGSNSCSSSLSYTVFARVTVLRNWIDQQMRNN